MERIPDLDDFARRVRPSIEKFVSRRVRNADHREEIVGRVFEALSRSWPTFRGDCPADAFAVRIAANAVRNYYERDLARFKRQISLEDWCESFCLQRVDGVMGPDREVINREEIEALLREMRIACSTIECTVVELVYQGHTMDEIGTLLDMKPATVRSHFLRGRERLLGHLLLNAPDLLGGTEAIDEAIRQSDRVSPLSEAEAEAVRTRRGPLVVVRKAMLKLAPFLGFLAWIALGGRG